MINCATRTNPTPKLVKYFKIQVFHFPNDNILYIHIALFDRSPIDIKDGTHFVKCIIQFESILCARR